MLYTKPTDQQLNIRATCDHWVGDPCYVVPEQHWDVLCTNWSAYDKQHQYDTDYKHHYVALAQDEESGSCFHLWSTAYGDGCYPLFVNDNQVAKLGVDAGVLSVIPMSLIEHWQKQGLCGDYLECGHVVAAEHLRGQMWCDAGDFFWGDLSLPTGELEQDESDEAEEEEFWHDQEPEWV